MNIFLRGFSDTITHIKTLIGAAFAGGVSLIALYLWKGREITAAEVPNVIVGIIGVLTGVFAIFLWNLILTPYRLLRDERNSLEIEARSLRSKNSLKEKIQDELLSRRIDAAAFLEQTVFPPYIMNARDVNEKLSIEKMFRSHLSSFMNNEAFRISSGYLFLIMENMWLLQRATESNASQHKRVNIASNLIQYYGYYVDICRKWLLAEMEDAEVIRLSNEIASQAPMMQYRLSHTATLRADETNYDISVTITHSPDPDPLRDF